VTLSEEQRAGIARVAEGHRLSLVLLFGSSATGDKIHAGSDYDIAVSGRDGLPDYRGYGALIADFQEVLPGREVDLVFLQRADPLFLSRIVENCVLLYGNPGELARLKIYAFKRYQDHRPYFEMESRYLRKFLEETKAGL